jgi:hypothetical protein
MTNSVPEVRLIGNEFLDNGGTGSVFHLNAATSLGDWNIIGNTFAGFGAGGFDLSMGGTAQLYGATAIGNSFQTPVTGTGGTGALSTADFEGNNYFFGLTIAGSFLNGRFAGGISGTLTNAATGSIHMDINNRGVTSTDPITASSFIVDNRAGAVINWYMSRNARNQKYWRWAEGTNGFILEAVNDAYSISTVAYGCYRTGYTVDYCQHFVPVIEAWSTVASLPRCNAGNKYLEQNVSDANATIFWSIVAGGGTNAIGVKCDTSHARNESLMPMGELIATIRHRDRPP